MAIGEDDYLAQDAIGLAGLIAGGQITAAEALEAALARSAKVNPKINAISLDLSERARRELAGKAPAGPLAGVPFLLKDLGPRLAGTATTDSCKLYADDIAETDSPLASLYKAAGLTIFGKTNTPELGLEPITEPVMFGPTRNPWDLSRSSGGSSGGAAAAVAAGILPAAHASDGGGSIRIPASCCGLFGLKPSRGRVPYGPGAGIGWNGLSTQHAVSISVRDSAALLDALSGPEPGDSVVPPKAHGAFLDAAGRAPGRLRVAVIEAAPNGAALHPDCQAALADAAALCESLEIGRAHV